MISQTTFVVLDLETTGLSAGVDHIIEWAAIRVENGEVTGELQSFINPGIYLPQEATQFTGITTEMVAKAPKFNEAAPELLDFFGEGSIFSAHNVAFDLIFLNKQLKNYGFSPLEIPSLCTYKLAKHLYPKLHKYSLGALASQFQIPLMQAHRAHEDALATAKLLIHFLKQLESEGVQELGQIPHLQDLKKLKTPSAQRSLF